MKAKIKISDIWTIIKTSWLENDGANGVNPFITAEDVPAFVETVSSTDNHIVVDNTDQQNPSLSFQLVDNENLLTDDQLAKVESYPEFPLVPVGDVLSDDGTFVKITQAVGGFANNLYFSDTDSDIVGYKTLNYEPDELPATMEVSAGSADGDKLCCSFLYPSPVAVDEIPAGLWSFSLWAYISSIAGVSNVGVRYFKYSTLGVKTYVFPEIVWSKEINNTTYDWIPIPTVQLSIPVDPTDRMGCDTFMKTSTAATKTTYVNVGDGNASYLNNPNALRHKVLRAINEELDYQHIDQTTEKTTPIDADSFAIWDSVALKFVRTSLTNFKTFITTNWSLIWAKEQSFTLGIKTGKIIVLADGTTALQITKADGTTAVIKFDTNGGITVLGSPYLSLFNSVGNQGMIIECVGGAKEQTYFRQLLSIAEYSFFNNNQAKLLFKILKDGSINVILWQYFSASTGDAIGDKRTGNVEGIQVTQTCTVANAVKGSGTWVNTSNQMSANTEVASATNVGCIRYAADANNSYCEMCMQTGAATYEWKAIFQNNW